jgi:hypothetical protein
VLASQWADIKNGQQHAHTMYIPMTTINSNKKKISCTILAVIGEYPLLFFPVDVQHRVGLQIRLISMCSNKIDGQTEQL